MLSFVILLATFMMQILHVEGHECVVYACQAAAAAKKGTKSRKRKLQPVLKSKPPPPAAVHCLSAVICMTAVTTCEACSILQVFLH